MGWWNSILEVFERKCAMSMRVTGLLSPEARMDIALSFF